MSTEILQITLPSDLVKRIREEVRSGHFASESDVIVKQFRRDEVSLTPQEEDEVYRLGFESLRELQENPESAVGLQQVRLETDEQHRRRVQVQ